MKLKLAAIICLLAAPASASYIPSPPAPATATWNSYYAFGDGITGGAYLSAPQAYPALINADLSGSLTNESAVSAYDCGIVDAKIFPNLNQASPTKVVATWLPDILSPTYGGGSASNQAAVKSCHTAGLTWLTVPSAYKTYAQSSACTQTGTWANDSSYGGAYGVTSDTSGSTLSCAVTSYGDPIYAWYRIHDNDGGTFTYSVDGGAAVIVPTNGGGSFSYPVDGTHYGVAAIRLPVAAGGHTVAFNVTSATNAANNVSIVGLGTAPGKPLYQAPTAFFGGQLYELNDQNSTQTAKYNADAKALVQQLQADGLAVFFVDVRKYVNATTDMAGGGDQYSPNATGQARIKDAFEGAMQFPANAHKVLIDPRDYGAVCNTQYFDGRNGSGVATMTASSPVISIGSYTFSPSDVGKTISINAGGGTAGVNTGTIASIASNGSTATLSVTPTVSSTSGYAVFGHDDTAAFTAASAVSALTGTPVLVPDHCGVRNFTPANYSTLTGLTSSIGYNYTPDIHPILYTLLTGYSEDTYKYGINLGTGMNGVALSGFQVKGATFPYLGFPGIVEACIGTDSGTAGYAQGILLEKMTVQSCPVGFGTAYGTTPSSHIFAQSRFNEFANNGDGWRGSYSDTIDIGSVFTGNFDAGVYMGLPGTPGYQSATNRFIATRFEEGKRGLVCAGCIGTHLEGVEFQFTAGYGIELGTGWSDFSMTGGFLQNNGSGNTSSITGAISGTTLTVSAVASGSLALNQTVTGAGVAAGTIITGFPTVATFTGAISGNTLTVSAVASGTLTMNQLITGAGVSSNTTISGYGTGTGGVGTYTISTGQTVASRSMTASATGNGGVGTYTVNNSQTVASESMATTAYADIGITGAANQGRLHLSNVQFPSIASSTPDYIIYSEVNPGNDIEIDDGDLWCSGNPGGAGKSFNVSLANWTTGVAPIPFKVRTTGCPLLAAASLSVQTASYALLPGDAGTSFTNTGASASETFTLPTASPGYSACFYVDAAQPIVVAADAGHTIRNGSSVTSAGGNLTSGSSIGGKVCVKALNATEWFVESINGSWTVN